MNEKREPFENSDGAFYAEIEHIVIKFPERIKHVDIYIDDRCLIIIYRYVLLSQFNKQQNFKKIIG